MAAPRKTTTTRATTAKAPATKAAPTTALSVEDLLAHTPDDIGAPKVDDQPVPASTPEPQQDKPEQDDEDSIEDAEIAKLKAELEEANRARLTPSRGERPLSEAELTPKQLEIRKLRDQVAQAKAKAFEASDTSFESANSDEVVRTIHFVADGFTAQARVWYTGQTVAFGAEAYEQTKDRFGNSWVDLTESEQWDRYGKVFFREGAWRGATYQDHIAEADRRRGDAAPLVSF